MKKFAIAGCGRLGRIVAQAWKNGLLPEYELCGTYSRTFGHAESMASDFGCRPCRTIDDIIALAPDIVVETASPAAMKEIAVELLSHGISIVTLSVGALADEAFYTTVARTASDSGAKVYIASGATGGFDVLQTAALMGDTDAHFFNEKGPDALKGTLVYDDSLQSEKREVFHGTAREAIGLFPTKVNVTVAASRASVGPEKMDVTMVSTPGFTGDTQRVEIRNRQVHAVVDVYSATSEIAGWSVVRVLRNIVSPIVF